MEDFHIDGFRFDATHAIIDTSARHIFLEMTTSIHQRGGYAIAEDSRNDAQLLSAEAAGGQDFDGVWADDFHHVIRVGQTGRRRLTSRTSKERSTS
jgi:maltooligosyltrehalose trehalohydrolase